MNPCVFLAFNWTREPPAIGRANAFESVCACIEFARAVHATDVPFAKPRDCWVLPPITSMGLICASAEPASSAAMMARSGLIAQTRERVEMLVPPDCCSGFVPGWRSAVSSAS